MRTLWNGCWEFFDDRWCEPCETYLHRMLIYRYAQSNRRTCGYRAAEFWTRCFFRKPLSVLRETMWPHQSSDLGRRRIRLMYKRLESGKYKWPRDSNEAKLITQKEFRWLMEGLSIDQKTAIKPAKKGKVCWVFNRKKWTYLLIYILCPKGLIFIDFSGFLW